MSGQPVMTRASGSNSDDRVFVYEVAGLRQNDQTDNNSYPVRNSSNLFIQVPYSRMNYEMRRIARLGGQIVSIRSASDHAASAENGSGEASNHG
jgi:phycocyanin-associated rod protein